MRETRADALVIGSGFGGAMAAGALLEAGFRVRMLERGPMLQRTAPAAPRGPGDLGPFFEARTPRRPGGDGNGWVPGDRGNVGGPSLYFAAVSSRFRAADFDPAPEIVENSGAAWPFDYQELEPFYTRAEQALGIAGPEQGGATEPPRSGSYPQPLPPLSRAGRRFEDAARRLGRTPSRLPLAINFSGEDGRRPCEACPFCDGFPCLIGAKNDVGSRLLPSLLRRGLRLEPSTAAVRLRTSGDRVTAVDALDPVTGEPSRHHADIHVLAAGALASPGLVLASGLDRLNPAGDLVGRFLMRHCNAHVFGLFWRRPDPDRRFHKELAIDDFYFGHPTIREPAGKLGMIQQMATPWVALVLLPRPLSRVVAPLLEHVTGLMVMAEDQPRRENRVLLREPDGDGPPRTRPVHEYTTRDLAARAALIRQAKAIVREAGAPFRIVFPIDTFSHAVGTLRMGTDPHSSVLDEDGRFRGLANLYVTDGSVMPTSAGVNPSLTIAAIALRTGERIVGDIPRPAAARDAGSARSAGSPLSAGSTVPAGSPRPAGPPRSAGSP